MKAAMKITMNNAAFEESGNGTELARILRELADSVEGDVLFAGYDCRLRDANGNTVGEFKVTR